VLWKTIENSANPADFQTYLNQYPNGAFAALAQRHLDEANEQARQQQLRMKAEQQRESAEMTRTDPATSLTWTLKDNGSDVNWQQATDYCKNLPLAGYSDWRLPTSDELEAIYDKTLKGKKYSKHVKGNLQLSGWQWSSSLIKSGWAWYFEFDDDSQYSYLFSIRTLGRALCVRRSGE
jgi:hypothetical protein